MTHFWPELADYVGVMAHTVSGFCAAYLAYWCWKAWRHTSYPLALALAWLAAVIGLLSVYRFGDILFDGPAHGAIVEFGLWIRVAHAVTMSFLALQVYKVGRV